MKVAKLCEFLQEQGICFLLDEPMSKHTSFCIGGPADVLINVPCVDSLPEIIKAANSFEIPTLIIGNGSNLLVSDKGIDGAVIKICDETVLVENNVMTCSAGAKFTRVSAVARDNSLKGLEFAFGIPGTVGGAVFMNAGAYGGEVKNVITRCTSLNSDGVVVTRNADELELGYRTSAFKSNGEVILKAEFTLCEGNKAEISSVMEDFMNRRKQKQPLELPSAGSTFKRPEGYFAGALIEQCGLKGYRVGGAAVSEKHAGFVVNLGGATCDDVLRLVEHIKTVVFKNFGVTLETEIIYKGR